MLTMFLLAASLSLDAFAVAVAHGLKSTRIPLASKLIVCFISVLYFGLSMLLGEGISRFFSPQTAKIIGIVLMSCICLWMLFQVLFGKKENPTKKTLLEVSLKSIGLTVKIIRNPMLCDIDRSHSISPLEAVFLGTALSVDSVSVGIGYSLLGSINIFAPILVGVFQFIFLWIGERIGIKANNLKNINTDYLQLISIGVMFILIIARIIV